MGLRESRQLRTTAMGYWPDAVALTSACRSRFNGCPDTNRALPAFNSARACCGVIAVCDCLVGGNVPATAGCADARVGCCAEWQPETISPTMKREANKAVRLVRGFMMLDFSSKVDRGKAF